MTFPLYAAIIGVDGSGKSSCFFRTMRILAGVRRTAGISDAVYMANENLGLTVSGRIRWEKARRWSRALAKRTRNPVLYKSAKLAELACWARIQRELEDYYGLDVVLGDGAPLVNVAGWGIRYHPDLFGRIQCRKALYYLSGARRIPPGEMLFYLTRLPEVFLFSVFGIAAFPVPDVIFLLKVRPAVALERISARGEKLQVHETLLFLGELQKAYELVCDILEKDLGRLVYRINVDDLTLDEAAAVVADRIESLTRSRRG